VVCKGPEFAVRIQTGCAHSSIAFRCPGCGRLYWDSGDPVLSRGFEKAFLTKHGLENRPLTAPEKAPTIRSLIKGAEGATDSDIGLISAQLSGIIRAGHAADCPATTGASGCLCGLEEAGQFVTAHPVPAEYMVV